MVFDWCRIREGVKQGRAGGFGKVQAGDGGGLGRVRQGRVRQHANSDVRGKMDGGWGG